MEVVLLTLQRDSLARTFSFDVSRQLFEWIGTSHESGSRHALASVETSDQGLLLRALPGHCFVVPGHEAALEDQVLVNCEKATLLGIERNKRGGRASLYIRPLGKGMCEFRGMLFHGDLSFEVGRGASCCLRYQSAYVSMRHARVQYAHNAFTVQDLKSGNGTFVNGGALAPLQRRQLVPGDIVRILDLVLVVGHGFLLVNHPEDLGDPHDAGIHVVAPDALPRLASDCVEGREPQAFYPAPLLLESPRPPHLSIDPPPERVQAEDQPLILRMGPSLLMGLGSAWMGGSAIASVARGDDLPNALPQACMALGMFCGMAIWPLASALYERRRAGRRERLRQERYSAYLDEIACHVRELAARHERILRERLCPVDLLLARARERSALLMNHPSEGDDFLRLRAGTGDCAFDAKIDWPQQGFLVQPDPLWDRVRSLRDRMPMLHGVPLALDLNAYRMVGVVGEADLAWEFLRGLLVQVCALYSPDEVRLAFVCHGRERVEWEAFSYVAHAYDEAEACCCVVSTPQSVERLDALIEHAGKDHATHLVVACTNTTLIRHSRTLGSVSARRSLPVSVVLTGRTRYDLPRESEFIVDLDNTCMFDRSDVSGTMARFEPDILVTREQAWLFARDLATVRVGTERTRAPETLGFLDLFRVGAVQQLNVGRRWAQGNAARSLRVPIGMSGDGRNVCVDLHERADGPHALVAGTTGSGKSELLITLVLSLCVAFSPDEVSFVLIDYKGGGLADAFENGRQRLPHLAGVITNLDGRAIGRTLASLGGEIRRRQRLLRAARKAAGESSMDIHRYLVLYRQGVVLDPLPHLFIVADEFAELRQQEPEFMDELMSAARIGRSLGVHLILATQKPSGIVNDQIWSNARLKVALKVSDVADSREVIRRDDAAFLRHPGSFLMLVGYDESFCDGQAAYAGLPYRPSSQYEPRRDEAVDLVDGEGQVVLSMGPPWKSKVRERSELEAVMGELMRVAGAQGLQAGSLWHAPLPACVPLQDVEGSYASQGGARGIALLGEVDDPAHQLRHPLAIDFGRVGNVLFVGTQGSGVEGLLRVTLVSLARMRGPDELWVYAADMGEGCLVPLEGLPQVGGVVQPGDDEGVLQLFRLLDRECEQRRALALEGTLAAPLLVVALTNVELLLEAYPELEDRLAGLVRDAPRLGVHVLATANGASGVQGRLRRGFDMVLPTLLADEGDYAYLLGTSRVGVPPAQWRRGLMRFEDEVLEFQGATLGSAREGERRFIDDLVEQWKGCGDAPAPPIPQLPMHVTWRAMPAAPKSPWLPVGYAKGDVMPLYVTFECAEAVLVVGDARPSLVAYLRGVMEVHDRMGGQRLAVADPLGWLGHAKDARVVSSIEGAEELLAGLGREDDSGVVIVADAPQVASMLSPAGRDALDHMVAQGSGKGHALVLVCEAWRLSGLYDPWYRALVAQGSGLWVGDGFDQQVVLRVPRLGATPRMPAGSDDGVLVEFGLATPVRVVREEVTHEGQGSPAGSRAVRSANA